MEPTEETPCPEDHGQQNSQQCRSFREAIAAVRGGAYSEGSEIATRYARDPSLPKLGRLLSGAVQKGRGRPVLPPSSLLPPLP